MGLYNVVFQEGSRKHAAFRWFILCSVGHMTFLLVL